MAGELLLDTGALVSILDRSQALVFTTDRRDFAIYRIRGRRRFRIVPE